MAGRVKYFILMTAVAFVLILMKGGKKIDSVISIEQCTFPYFGLLLLMAVVFYAFFVMIRRHYIQENDYTQEDIEVINRNARSGLLTGLIGGLIGIGGGMILTAEWLQLGLHP